MEQENQLFDESYEEEIIENEQEFDDEYEYVEDENVEEYAEEEAAPDETDEDVSKFKPIINLLSNDDQLRDIVTYRSYGYTTDQIIDGLFLQRHPELHDVIRDYYQKKGSSSIATVEEEEDETPPEFDTYEEEVRYYARKEAERALRKVLNDIAPKVQELMNKQQALEQEARANYIRSVNNQAMSNAIREFGLSEEDLTQEDIKNIARNLKTLYPGVDFRNVIMTPDQARIILAASLGAPKRTPSTKQLVKQQLLPKVQPTGKTVKGQVVKKEIIDGLSKNERLKRLMDL